MVGCQFDDRQWRPVPVSHLSYMHHTMWWSLPNTYLAVHEDFCQVHILYTLLYCIIRGIKLPSAYHAYHIVLYHSWGSRLESVPDLEGEQATSGLINRVLICKQLLIILLWTCTKCFSTTYHALTYTCSSIHSPTYLSVFCTLACKSIHEQYRLKEWHICHMHRQCISLCFRLVGGLVSLNVNIVLSFESISNYRQTPRMQEI